MWEFSRQVIYPRKIEIINASANNPFCLQCGQPVQVVITRNKGQRYGFDVVTGTGEEKSKGDLEGVHTIYKDNKLVAIIKRDEVSKKHLVYLVEEAVSEDIANLINKQYNIYGRNYKE